jgi:hypothetical protein
MLKRKMNNDDDYDVEYNGNFQQLSDQYRYQKIMQLKFKAQIDPLHQWNLNRPQEQEYGKYRKLEIDFYHKLRKILVDCAPLTFNPPQLIDLVFEYKKATLEEYLEFYGYISQEERQIIMCMLGRLFSTNNDNNIEKDTWQLGIVILHDHSLNGRSDLTHALMNLSLPSLLPSLSSFFDSIWNFIIPPKITISSSSSYEGDSYERDGLDNTRNNVLYIIDGETMMSNVPTVIDELTKKKFVLFDVPSSSIFPSYFWNDDYYNVSEAFQRRIFSLKLFRNEDNSKFHDFLHLDALKLIKIYQIFNEKFSKSYPWTKFISDRFLLPMKYDKK